MAHQDQRQGDGVHQKNTRWNFGPPRDKRGGVRLSPHQ